MSSTQAPQQNPQAETARRRIRFPSFGTQIIIALVLGVALGFVAREMGPVDADTPNWLTDALATVGSSFINLLRAVVPPLVFLAIVASVANLRQVKNAARLAGQTLLWFAITALISVGIGMALGLVLQPGNATSINPDTANAPGSTGSWTDFLVGLLPTNVLGIEGTAPDGGGSVGFNFNVLQIVVISIVVGLAALKVGRQAEPFLTFAGSALAVVQKVLWWIIRLAPLGTLPLTQRVTERNLGVPQGYASFAVPLAATTKMDGCAAIYPAISAIFVAQFYGIQLSITDYLLIAFVSVVGSAATAGLTGAIVMLTLTLSTLGLPLEGVGLLIAIDSILDMGRTAVNVAGQALVPTLVAKREGILDQVRYDSASAEDLFSDEPERELVAAGDGPGAARA